MSQQNVNQNQELKTNFSSSLIYNPENKEKSAEYFKDTKVHDCSYVKMKQGSAMAIPYYESKQGNLGFDTKSTYTQSYSHEVYKVRPNLHVGSATKLLEPYNPNAFRNRLPIEDAPLLTKNASQVEIGERNFNVKRHFLSTAKNVYGNFGKFGPVNNPGILSDKTKWHHHQQQK